MPLYIKNKSNVRKSRKAAFLGGLTKLKLKKAHFWSIIGQFKIVETPLCYFSKAIRTFWALLSWAGEVVLFLILENIVSHFSIYKTIFTSSASRRSKFSSFLSCTWGRILLHSSTVSNICLNTTLVWP